MQCVSTEPLSPKMHWMRGCSALSRYLSHPSWHLKLAQSKMNANCSAHFRSDAPLSGMFFASAFCNHNGTASSTFNSLAICLPSSCCLSIASRFFTMVLSSRKIETCLQLSFASVQNLITDDLKFTQKRDLFSFCWHLRCVASTVPLATFKEDYCEMAVVHTPSYSRHGGKRRETGFCSFGVLVNIARPRRLAVVECMYQWLSSSKDAPNVIKCVHFISISAYFVYFNVT